MKQGMEKMCEVGRPAHSAQSMLRGGNYAEMGISNRHNTANQQ